MSTCCSGVTLGLCGRIASTKFSLKTFALLSNSGFNMYPQTPTTTLISAWRHPTSQWSNGASTPFTKALQESNFENYRPSNCCQFSCVGPMRRRNKISAWMCGRMSTIIDSNLCFRFWRVNAKQSIEPEWRDNGKCKYLRSLLRQHVGDCQCNQISP